MSNSCSYKDCPNVQRTFASKTFFNLPIDSRRETWIANSGNEQLKSIDSSVRRVFCEDHFEEKYLRRQFNRTILRREAVPYPFGEVPDSHEIEFIELTEEDADQIKPEVVESNIEPKEVVIFLNKTPQTRVIPEKVKQVHQMKIAERNNLKPLKIVKRKNVPIVDDKDVEVDLILVQDPDPITETNEIEPSSEKKLRLQMDSNSNQSHSQSDQNESVREQNVIQRKSPPQIESIETPRIETTPSVGVVSSSETVDSNNEETYFALSLVGILKRLPPHKRAIAKCHIISYLTELEYGSNTLS